MKLLTKHLFFLVFCTSIFIPSFSQVAPAAKGGSGFGQTRIFAEFTAGKPNYEDEFLVGPTIGGYIPLNGWIAGEARGSVLKWGPSPFHQDTALFGPRVQYPGHKITPYAAFDFGIAHVTYPLPNSQPSRLTSSNELAWELATGVDYRFNHRFSLRLGEFTYGSINVLQNGLNPKTFSSGVVVRVF
jgi:hypothetical protein